MDGLGSYKLAVLKYRILSIRFLGEKNPQGGKRE